MVGPFSFDDIFYVTNKGDNCLACSLRKTSSHLAAISFVEI
jgi:hypothetical protein